MGLTVIDPSLPQTLLATRPVGSLAKRNLFLGMIPVIKIPPPEAWPASNTGTPRSTKKVVIGQKSQKVLNGRQVTYRPRQESLIIINNPTGHEWIGCCRVLGKQRLAVVFLECTEWYTDFSSHCSSAPAIPTITNCTWLGFRAVPLRLIPDSLFLLGTNYSRMCFLVIHSFGIDILCEDTCVDIAR